jgi:hypothetical protein
VAAAPNGISERGSVPAQIGDIGHVFKATIGFWFPTFRVASELRASPRAYGRAGELTNSIYGATCSRGRRPASAGCALFGVGYRRRARGQLTVQVVAGFLRIVSDA